jgi:hypothetical protein
VGSVVGEPALGPVVDREPGGHVREELLTLLTPESPGVERPPLLGRDYQVMSVEEVLDDASAQVVGMPGSGVSAILDAVVERRLAAGRAVLRIPVSPWSAETTPASPLSQLDALLPHLQAPTVVLDDAHLVSLEDLSALITAVEDRAGRVLLGVHPGELVDLDIVHLPGLSRDTVRLMLTAALDRRLGFSDEYLVAGLSRATRGHVSHVLALLEQPVLRELQALAEEKQDLDELREDFADALADSTQDRLSTLQEPSRLAVAITALAGPHAPGILLDAAAGVDQLSRAREAGLLERSGDSHRFRHAAVRDLVRRGAPEDVMAEARWRISVAAQAAGLHHAPPGVF